MAIVKSGQDVVDILTLQRSKILNVEVVFVGGHNLAAKDSNGLSDPFGVLLLNNQRKFKTKVIKKTLFPTWSEKALLPAVEVTSSLVVQIWDHDAVTAAEFLGQVTLNMEELPIEKEVDLKLPLKHRDGHASEDVTGDIILKYSAVPCVSGPLFRRTDNKLKRWVKSTGYLFRQSLLLDEEILFTKDSSFLSDTSDHTRMANAFVLKSGTSDHILRAPSTADKKMWLDAMCKVLRKGDEGEFGVALDELLLRQKEKGKNLPIPWFVAQLIDYIREKGLSEVGIFRESGSATEMAECKRRLAKGQMFLAPNECIHNASNLLKEWLRSLPEPLLTFALYDRFIAAADVNDDAIVIQQLTEALAVLPPPNTAVLQVLLLLLQDVANSSAKNRMTPSNLSIVFGPSLLWDVARDPLRCIKDVRAIATIAEVLIVNLKVFYPTANTPAPAKPRLLRTATMMFGPRKMIPSAPTAPTKHHNQEQITRKRKNSVTSALEDMNEADAEEIEKRAVQLFGTYDIDKNGSLDIDEYSAFVQDMLRSTKMAQLEYNDVINALQLLLAADSEITLPIFLTWWRKTYETVLKS